MYELQLRKKEMDVCCLHGELKDKTHQGHHRMSHTCHFHDRHQNK